MAENPSVVVDGDVSPFRRALLQAKADLEKFAKDGSRAMDDMQSPIMALREKYLMVGAAIAAITAAGAKALAFTAEWAESSIDLGNALGISATQANNLRAALANEGVEISEFVGAAQKMSANIRENEDDIRKMGLATRDASGNLRPLNDLTLDAIKLLGDYKAGTDRAIAAGVLFGKGFEINGNLMKINSDQVAEITARQQRLNATLGEEGVAAFQEYDDASKDAKAAIDAVWTTVGQQLMPIMTDLCELFSSVAPAALTVIKGALGGLAAIFHGLSFVVKSLVEIFVIGFKNMMDIGSGFGEMMSALFRGDFAGAAAAASRTFDTVKGNFGEAFAKITADAEVTRDRLYALFANPIEIAAPKAVEGKSANALVKPKKEEKSQIPELEGRLDALKRAASDENALLEYSKAKELAYWNDIIAKQQLSAKDRLAVEKKVTDLTLSVRKEAIQKGFALNAEDIRSVEAMALARMDAEQAATEGAIQAEFESDAVKKTKLLAAEKEFEDRRYQIKLAALEGNLQLIQLDPNTSPVELMRIHSEIEQLELQHRARRLQLSSQMITAQRDEIFGASSILGTLGQSMATIWDSGLNAMMNGTLRWRNAVRAIGAELTRWFVVNVVGAQVKEYIAGQARMVAAKILGLTQETTAQTTASSTIIGTKAGETTTVVTGNAVQAGSGAAKALSGIPYVGPVLALAAMASVFAAVMGMAGRTKSARGGYDIPAGLNPMTQLHEEEMVLPKEYANTIRSLAAGQDGMGSGGVVNYNDYSGKLSESDIRRKGRVIADVLNEVYKNGWRPA